MYPGIFSKGLMSVCINLKIKIYISECLRTKKMEAATGNQIRNKTVHDSDIDWFRTKLFDGLNS